MVWGADSCAEYRGLIVSVTVLFRSTTNDGYQKQRLRPKFLPLDSGTRNALDEMLLADEEHHDDRQNTNDRARLDQLPAPARLIGQQRQPQGDGHGLDPGEEDQRAHEIIPGVEEGEDAQRGQGGFESGRKMR